MRRAVFFSKFKAPSFNSQMCNTEHNILQYLSQALLIISFSMAFSLKSAAFGLNAVDNNVIVVWKKTKNKNSYFAKWRHGHVASFNNPHPGYIKTVSVTNISVMCQVISSIHNLLFICVTSGSIMHGVYCTCHISFTIKIHLLITVIVIKILLI